MTIKKTIITILSFLLFLPQLGVAQECMIGEVRYFAGNFAPRSWALANGQLTPHIPKPSTIFDSWDNLRR